jgi:NlpC/P60 family
MHLKAKGVRLVLACLLIPATLAAQQGGKARRGATQSPDESRAQSLLNTSEGLTVIAAALESRDGSLSRLDCSHLVHSVYQRAGFPYSYVSSSDLYAGVDEFREVAHPHVGDLVVWPGHVGIVVNPAESTFFSALRSGAGVESYSSSYWRERGAPRFYRYAKVAAKLSQETAAETPGVTRTALATAVDGESRLPGTVNPADIRFPRVQLIHSAKPQNREVTQALQPSLNADLQGLREVDLFKLPRPMIVFSQVEVRTVKVHGQQGQAQVRITALLSLDGGQMNLKQWQQIQTWPMRRRDGNSWELLLPQDAIYVPRATAVRVLAHQLSLLADAESPAANSQQTSQLAQMLNAILTN